MSQLSRYLRPAAGQLRSALVCGQPAHTAVARTFASNPLDLFRPFESALNRVFSMDPFPQSFFQGPMVPQQLGAIDVVESEKNLTFTADTPGMKKSDIKIEVTDGNTLTISGERKNEHKTEDKKNHVHRIERTYGSFSRSFRLPEAVDASKISATFEDGTLKIVVPKSSPSQPRVVSVNIQDRLEGGQQQEQQQLQQDQFQDQRQQQDQQQQQQQYQQREPQQREQVKVTDRKDQRPSA